MDSKTKTNLPIKPTKNTLPSTKRSRSKPSLPKSVRPPFYLEKWGKNKAQYYKDNEASQDSEADEEVEAEERQRKAAKRFHEVDFLDADDNQAEDLPHTSGPEAPALSQPAVQSLAEQLGVHCLPYFR